MRNLLTPIFSMAILTLGNGFFTTLTTVELNAAHWANWSIGVVSAMYFLGLTIGALMSNKLVVRVGHLRAYAVYAAVMAIVTLMQGMLLDFWLWCVLRFITGYVLAGLFIVIEGWVLDASHESKRGANFAVYLLAYYFAQSIGQLFLGIHFPYLLQAFVLVAILITASIIPVSSTRVEVPVPQAPELGSPKVLWNKARLAVIGGVVSGVVVGAIYSIYPLFLAHVGQGRSDISYIMLVVVLGGALLQYPIGWMSDRYDRRLIIATVSWATVVVSVAMIFWHQSFMALMIGSFILGGLTFTLFPLSIGNASDCFPKNMSVQLITIMTFLYGLGTFVGPLLTTGSMHLLGQNGFFVLIIIVYIIIGTFSVARLLIREARPHNASFVGAINGKPVDSEELIEGASER